MTEPKNVSDLPRNDVAACERFYRARGKLGIESDEAEVMLRLQDDPSELEAKMMKWKIRDPIAGRS